MHLAFTTYLGSLTFKSKWPPNIIHLWTYRIPCHSHITFSSILWHCRFYFWWGSVKKRWDLRMWWPWSLVIGVNIPRVMSVLKPPPPGRCYKTSLYACPPKASTWIRPCLVENPVRMETSTTNEWTIMIMYTKKSCAMKVTRPSIEQRESWSLLERECNLQWTLQI